MNESTVAIIGAGPAGLATAVCLGKHRVSCTVFDRSGVAGGAFREMPQTMNLLSPRRYIHLPHYPFEKNIEYPSMPAYAQYLDSYAKTFGVAPQQTNINSITPHYPNGFALTTSSGVTHVAQFVVVATGIFNNPKWPIIEGLELTQNANHSVKILHSHDWVGPENLHTQRVLIIGSGISGVGIAEECANAGHKVFVSRRSNYTRLVKPRLLGLDILHWFRPLEFLPRNFFGPLCQRGIHAPAYDNGYRTLVKSGKIIECPTIESIDGNLVKFTDRSQCEADTIIAATGYSYNTEIFPPSFKREPGGHPATKNNESLDWQGLFFVGSPCARRIDSEYLRGIASDAQYVANCISKRINQL